MSVFAKAATSRSRKAVITGIALIGASALVLSGCAASTTDEPAGPVEDYTLKIGTLLPQTGNLAFLGPPEEAGVAMAAAEVNDAAADTGLTVEVTYGDSGDTDNKAYETEAPRILAEGVSAIIGAASSGTSLQFIDQVVGEGVIQFSPANTSDAFTTYDDNGLYFRTAPSDVLQGEVLGNLIAEDGNQTLGMIVLNDSYGTGLAKYVTEAFEAAGGEVVAAPTYNTGDTNFDAQISEVLAAAPDAIALITFDRDLDDPAEPLRPGRTGAAVLRGRQPVELRRRVRPRFAHRRQGNAPGTVDRLARRLHGRTRRIPGGDRCRATRGLQLRGRVV